MQSDVQCQYFMSLRSYVGKGRNLSFRACEPTTNSPSQGPELPSEGSRLGVSCDNYKREFIGNPETRLGVSERRSTKRRTAIRRAPTITLPEYTTRMHLSKRVGACCQIPTDRALEAEWSFNKCTSNSESVRLAVRLRFEALPRSALL